MEENKKATDEGQKKEIKLPTVVLSIVVILFIFLGIMAVAIYAFGIESEFVKKTEKSIPFPVAMVGWSPIRFSELNGKVDSVRRFYENQDFSSVGMRVDFSTEDGKKRLKIKERDVLAKLIENLIVEKECKKRGIVLTSEMVSQEVDRTMKEYDSGDDLRDNLFRLYGWTVSDFEKNIVRPDMLQEKLMKEIKEKEPSYLEARAKIEKALAEVKGGKNFSEVVKKYSEGGSVKEGGDLGWFGSEEMLPEISKVVFLMDKGKTSEIIESPLGYHIVRLEDKKTQNGEEKVNVKQIFVKTKTLGDWLSDFEKETKVLVFKKGLFWNNETQQVEFKNGEMKDFESKIDAESGGNAAVAF